MKARDLMTGIPIALSPGATVEEAAGKMRDLDVGAVLIWEAGAPCGIVTDRDIAISAVAQGKGSATEIGEIATPTAVVAAPDDDIPEVARLMRQHRIRRLPVVQDERPIGLISLDDIALADPLLAGEILSDLAEASTVRTSQHVGA